MVGVLCFCYIIGGLVWFLIKMVDFFGFLLLCVGADVRFFVCKNTVNCGFSGVGAVCG